MNEEIKPDVAPTEVAPEQSQEQQAPEYTKIELQAMEMGWRPMSEFNGDEDDFIDAKEFVRRKPLFDKIERTGSELKQVKRALDALKTHYTTVHETAYKEALANLKQARKQAITDSDGERFDQIDQQIKEVEAAAEKVKQVAQDEPVQEAPVNPKFVEWANRNPWYTSVDYMRAYADKRGVELHQQGLTPLEVLKKVEEDVRKEFPHKFRNSNKDDAPMIENSNARGTSGSNKKDSFQLSPAEERIMNTLIKSDPKTFTKEKYIAELKVAKGIK